MQSISKLSVNTADFSEKLRESLFLSYFAKTDINELSFNGVPRIEYYPTNELAGVHKVYTGFLMKFSLFIPNEMLRKTFGEFICWDQGGLRVE